MPRTLYLLSPLLFEGPNDAKTPGQNLACAPFTGGKRLPIVAWGNGACSNAGLLFQTFLSNVASHGYVVIVSGPKDAPLPAFASQRPANAPPPQPGVRGSKRRGRLRRSWRI